MSALIAVAAALLWGTSDFLGGLATRRRPIVEVLVVSTVAALFVVGLWAAGTALLSSGWPSLGYWTLWGVAAGVTGVVALASFYSALALGPMGIVAPVSAMSVAVPVVVGLAEGDQPRPAQLAGLALGAVGILLASGPELRQRGEGGPRALILAVVSAVTFGLSFVCMAEGSAHSVVLTILLQRSTSLLLLAPVAVLALRRNGRAAAGEGESRLRPRRVLVVMAVVGVIDLAANACYGQATRGGLLSVVSVLTAMYPVVTVLLARQLLAERLRRVQVVGVGAAFGGVALLAGG